MKRKTKNAFTLVELLAVIVILAIILVIAVPKVMSVIEDSKKATLESTAKMIASSAEKQKVQNTVLGNDKEITCESITNINKVDYPTCNIEFEDNIAKVTIIGGGKFEGLNVCGGTKTSASATNESCGLICEYGIKKVANAVTPYEVKDYDSCVSHLSSELPNYGAPQEFIDEQLPTLCEGGSVFSESFSEVIERFVGMGITKADLIENNVIKGTIEEECLELTPEECFAFDSEEGAITGYDISCGTDVVIPSQINGKNVVLILKKAFRGAGITSVYLPNTIEYIGLRTFESNYISEIEIPSSVTTIDTSAFGDNPLINVKINNLDAEIGCGAFGDASRITTHNLPENYMPRCPA